ncbi:MAG: SPOR domain-containing protein, partial [Saprospiraceae bacterium]
STSQDEHASYSNKGEVDIVAPSNGDWPITAARAWWDEGVLSENGEFRFWRDGQGRSTNHKHFGGTSSSCPLVAGICALVLSANPELTAKEVKAILCRTADKIGNPSDYDDNGHSWKYGHGRVNADRAVAEAIRMRDGEPEPEQGEVSVADLIKQGKGIFEFSVIPQEPKGFGVQIGAFAKYGNVLIQVEKLQSQFKKPIVVSINELDGKTVYKIMVGNFKEKDDARSLKKQMKAAGVDGFVRNFKDLVE